MRIPVSLSAGQDPADTPAGHNYHAEDTDNRWLITTAPDAIISARGGESADAASNGLSADLHLALWNRLEDQAITIGEPGSQKQIWLPVSRVNMACWDISLP